MDLVPITIQIRNRDITFVTKDGVSKGVVNILGKVTTIMHKTVQTFEDTVEVEEPAELLEKSSRSQVALLEGASLAARPLSPGYCDQGRQQSGPHRHLRPALNVPIYQDEKLGASSLILADEMHAVSSRAHRRGTNSSSAMLDRSARNCQPRHSRDLQPQSGSQFLDAVLQSWYR